MNAPAAKRVAADPAMPRLYCTFVVAERGFAVDAGAVTEVFRGAVTTTVPRGPASIRGLLNLRGRIVPAIDMRWRLGLGAAAGGDGLHVVVEAAGGEAYSLIVDRVADVVVIPDDGIEIPSGAAGGLAEDCIAGVHAAATGLVYVLSLDAIVAGLAESTTERTQA